MRLAHTLITAIMSLAMIIQVSVSTTSEDAYSSLMALASASPTFVAAALTAAAPVTNSDGRLFALCTSAVVFNSTQGIDPAPSPPPPSPPPFSNALGGLDVLDFVNVSSPASAALTTLLTAAAPTVQAAAAAAVSVSVAASVGASAVGGAASGGGGPAALAGAQRNALMAMLGGAPSSCEDPRATGTGGGWTMGRFGMGSSSNPCVASTGESSTEAAAASQARRLEGRWGREGSGRGRRLASKEKHKDDQGDDEILDVDEEVDEDLVQRLLVVALVDALTSTSMVIELSNHLTYPQPYPYNLNSPNLAPIRRSSVVPSACTSWCCSRGGSSSTDATTVGSHEGRHASCSSESRRASVLALASWAAASTLWMQALLVLRCSQLEMSCS